MPHYFVLVCLQHVVFDFPGFLEYVLYRCQCSPLGPFVPAPPDVAMRMIREQGGPPPFEGGGRNGRPGGHGPAPILISPALRQDPRRLRR